MNRPRRNRKRIESVRQELRGALKLAPWFLALLFVVFLVWRPDLSASPGLFQSGVPTATDEPPTPVPTLTPTTAPSATLPATESPMASPTAGATTPVATLTVPPETSPTHTATSLPSATLPPTEAATSTPSPTWTPAPPTATLIPSATLPAEGGPDHQRYAEGDSAYRFEWGMLVDSFALAASYLWLCCGVLLLVAVPIVFIVLWVASRRRNQAD
jgi:hypothetical protein